MSYLLRPFVERRTYASLLWLLLGLPLGIAYLVLLVTGLSLGLGLLVTVAGIPVLVGTLVLVRGLAAFERGLAQVLLDAPMPNVVEDAEAGYGIFWARLRALVRRRRTWAELGYLLLRFPLGVVDFCVAVTVVSLALGGFAEPIVVAAGAHTEIGRWHVDTVPEALLFILPSIVFLAAAPHLLRGWASVSARLATACLGRVEAGELRRGIARVLARDGEVDAFRILDALRLSLGSGPFLNATRVEAALLVLQDSRLVSSRQADGRVLYTLEASHPPLIAGN
ncbi:MAG: sensor domain-containing protein [Gaiellaceae bacterium]